MKKFKVTFADTEKQPIVIEAHSFSHWFCPVRRESILQLMTSYELVAEIPSSWVLVVQQIP